MIEQQKCHVCDKLCDVVMSTPISRYVKVCLDCYTEADTKNEKDFGFPEVKRNTGTHKPE